MIRIVLEAIQVRLGVVVDVYVLVIELLLNLGLFGISSPLVHTAGGVVELMHNMHKDT
jgi:hypothetical protein